MFNDTNRVTDSIETSQLPFLNIGDYVACLYNKEWYIGAVEEFCEEEGDVKVILCIQKDPYYLKTVHFDPPQTKFLMSPEHRRMSTVDSEG